MLRVLFLILIVISSFVFAQTDEKPKAIKIDEVERANDEDISVRLDALFIELNNNPSANGYIINYGTNKDISRREGQLKKLIAFRRYDASRITFLNGGLSKTIKTEMWVNSTK